MKSSYPTPKMKEALHQIKRELNYSENFHSNSLTGTLFKTSITNKRNLVAPSPISQQGRRSSSPIIDRTAPTYSHSFIASSLLVLNLASNAASHFALWPKITYHHAPNTISIYPPFKGNTMFPTSLHLALLRLVSFILQRWSMNSHILFLRF